jgi:hypothetical protein
MGIKLDPPTTEGIGGAQGEECTARDVPFETGVEGTNWVDVEHFIEATSSSSSKADLITYCSYSTCAISVKGSQDSGKMAFHLYPHR